GTPVDLGAAHAGGVTGVAFPPTAGPLLSVGADGLLKFWAVTATPPRPDRPPITAHDGGVAAVVYHANARQAFTAGADRLVKLWEVAGGRELRRYGPLPGPVPALARSRDAARVAAAAGRVVTVWNTADGTEVRTFTHAAPVTAIALSNDKTK